MEGDSLREWRCGSNEDQGGAVLQAAVREHRSDGVGKPTARRMSVVEHLCIRTYPQLGNKDYGWFFDDSD